MADNNGLAADGGVAESSISVVTTGGSENFNTPSAAAKALRAARTAKEAAARQAASTQNTEVSTQATGAEQAAEPAPESEPVPGNDAAPPQEVTGETQDADPAQQEPPLERPRSWSKDRQEAWSRLDRDIQQTLLDHDREASSAVRKAQNEAAEQRKALEADRAKVEQAKQQYESALPILLQNLQTTMAGEFSDIKTMADVQRLAKEDWPRYVQWDAQQKQVAAVQQEIKASQERQAIENFQKWGEFAKREDDLFTEKVPELADKKKAAELQDKAVEMLRDIGFQDDELGKLWSGQDRLSLRDHRLQLLILDGVRYREAKQKAVVAQRKPVPPVQRPGVSQPKGAQLEAQTQALSQKLDQAKGTQQSLRAAAALVDARRAAQR